MSIDFEFNVVEVTYKQLSSSISAEPPTSSAEAILHRVFRSHARYTLRMGSTVVINHCASEWVSSCCCSSSTRSGQINELSAAWPSFLTAVLLILPVTPSAKNCRDTDCVVNPLQPISTGKFYVFNSTLCQEFITLALFLSLASLYLYYHGTVDSITMTFFIRVYQSKAWG